MMILTRTAAFGILCVVMVAAVPSRITKHYELDGNLGFSFVKNTSLLYVTGHPELGRSGNEETAPVNVTLEDFNFDGSSKKSSCIINPSPIHRFIRVDKEHLLAAWTNRDDVPDRSLYLMNVNVRNCKVTLDTVPVPPFNYFPSEHYLHLIVNENNYSVVIPHCLENYNKPCKNVFDLAGNSIEKSSELNGIEKYQSPGCTFVGKNDKPSNDFIAACEENDKYTAYLIKGGKVKVLKVLPNIWSVAAYGDDIVICPSTGDVLRCIIFDGEGSLKHEITLNIISKNVHKIHLLPDGFLISYEKRDRIPKTYVTRYNFEGNIVKKYVVDDKIRRTFGNDIFQNDAGEYCVSLFGTKNEDFSTSFDYVTQCLQDL